MTNWTDLAAFESGDPLTASQMNTIRGNALHIRERTTNATAKQWNMSGSATTTGTAWKTVKSLTIGTHGGDIPVIFHGRAVGGRNRGMNVAVKLGSGAEIIVARDSGGGSYLGGTHIYRGVSSGNNTVYLRLQKENATAATAILRNVHLDVREIAGAASVG